MPPHHLCTNSTFRPSGPRASCPGYPLETLPCPEAGEAGPGQVGGVRVEWAAVEADDVALALLPKMRIDVCLESTERRLVVDCKYYSQTL